MSGVFAARARGGELSYLPQPSRPISGSPFTVTGTSVNIGPVDEGVLLLSVQSSIAHFRVHRAGESINPATTGDISLTQISNLGPHLVPVRKDDVVTIVSGGASSTVQISQGRTG